MIGRILPSEEEVDIIIIGGGVVGLTLAHSLEKHGISYKILERDASIDSRGNGWGITIHWAREALKKCIPENLYDSLESITVDPDMKSKDPGNYKFFNLETLERAFVAPVDPTRMRIRREGFRKLLLSHIDVQWDVKVSDITPIPDGKGVSVTLPDQTTVRGKLLVGADGSNSVTRKFLCGPERAQNIPLPLRFIGVLSKMTPETTMGILNNVDPLIFQGCHPETGVYMFWCLVSTPETNGSGETDAPYYTAQVCVSWKPQEGEEDVPPDAKGKVRRLRELSANMGAPVREMINKISEDSDVITSQLQDWLCLDWDNYGGRVTLAGDSAHAITMYRGEAANFGITDAADLTDAIVAFMREGVPQKDAIDRYESILRPRSKAGVQASRQACLDGHNLQELTDKSPLLYNR